MKLENQVVSLKYAKRLKELGFKQKSYWHWYDGKGFENEPTLVHPSNPYKKVASAFSVAELGEMLPRRFEKGKQSYYLLDVQIRPQGIYVYYSFLHASLEDRITVEDKTEANARAKMLIYLKENKII